jgi:hypothetical protein
VATFTAVDGGTVEIGGDGLEIDAPLASRIAEFRGSLGEYEFTVVPTSDGHVDEAASHEGIRLVESYGLRSGHAVRIGANTATDAVTKVVGRSVLGVWVGSQFAVEVWLQGEESPTAERDMTALTLTILNQFEITETPTGVAMRPIVLSDFALVREAGRAPSVLVSSPGLGLVKVVARTSEQKPLMPNDAGARVDGGQLWVSARSPADAVLDFLLESETAVAHVYTDAHEVAEDTLLERASHLVVEWKAGAL